MRRLRHDLDARYERRRFRTDGFFIVNEEKIALEVKGYSFGSRGMCNEKLPGFFETKLPCYGHRCLIILCGEHEVLNDEESFALYAAFKFPHRTARIPALAITHAKMQAVRQKDLIYDIVKLTELPKFLSKLHTIEGSFDSFT